MWITLPGTGSEPVQAENLHLMLKIKRKRRPLGRESAFGQRLASRTGAIRAEVLFLQTTARRSRNHGAGGGPRFKKSMRINHWEYDRDFNFKRNQPRFALSVRQQKSACYGFPGRGRIHNTAPNITSAVHNPQNGAHLRDPPSLCTRKRKWVIMCKQRAVYPLCMEAVAPYAGDEVFVHLVPALHFIVPYQ